MKNTKLMFLMIVGLLMVFVITACGGGDEESSGQSNEDDTSDASASEAPVEEGEAEGEGDLDESVSIGTHASGSGYHTVGAGFAKLISSHTSIRGNVTPSAGPQAWMGDLNSGGLELGLISGPDLSWAYTGGPGYDEANEKVRMIFGGMPMYQTGYGVPADSDIQGLSDLEGKAIGAEFGGNLFMNSIAEATLKSVGLTWDDVNPVPVPEFQAGLDALQGGTLDSTIPASPTAAKAMEVSSAIGGIRVLPFGGLQPEDIEDGIPEEFQDLFDEYMPTSGLATVPAGTGILEEDTVHITYDMNLVVNDGISDDTVYEILKAVWENSTEMNDLISYTETLSPDTMLVSDPGAPYHEGAIKFYKEVGVWTDELQEKQDELLAN
ncbi:TAXI family TRAP transporter solute-binding subunit [Salibacterium salarium]|uniref:TAXI family TRAP transporter solute-binding subunit n=1 Tax=Salibacterium salarium TaxID=284579 RepID=A0A428MVI4_9BACI|nr:TAXI family TRAP transporter solute-binding subunit [Salibacterium salarium]RSL30141.1 TAXI family TRAP transporter solute-binding subunit [Salibacterium salarium]